MRCYRCNRVHVPNEGDLCPDCFEFELDQALEEQEKDRQRLLAYTGDQYLTDSWIEDGYPFDEAKRIAEDPFYIGMDIEWGELATVLADKYSTATLRKLLLERNPHILRALGSYTRRRRVRRKPGRKAKSDGRYLYQKVHDLLKSGLTMGQVAHKVWGPKAKRNLADAHYRRALKRGLPPIKRQK